MWRSKASAVIFRSPIRKVPSSELQVVCKTLIPTSFQSPDSSSWVFTTSSHFQNPRFFSQKSVPVDHTIHDKAEAIEDDGKNLSFDENPDFVSEESVTFSAISDDMINNNIDNENPSFSLEGDDEEMDNVISEEATEETPAEIPEVNIEQVESVLSVLQSSLAAPLESSLDELGLDDVTEEFVVRVIQTPNVLGESLIGFFKWASNRLQFLTSTRAVHCLVQAVSAGRRRKEAYALWDLIKEIGEKEKGLITTDILNQLISLFWMLGKGKAGLEVFNKFDEFECKHDADTYYPTVEALCTRLMFDDACCVCEKMLNSGCLPDSEKLGKIIAGLCKGRKAKDAHLVYLMAKENNKYPPKSSVNLLISKLCADDETVHLATEMLGDFSEESRKYAIKPFSSVIRGLCRTQRVEEAKKLLFKMMETGPYPGNAVFNSIINGLSKAGDMLEAIELMKVMASRGLRPDVYTYTVIISGFAKGGQMDDACRILSEAKKKHSKLTPVTYHTIIRGYCKLEEFDRALEFLREMNEYGVQPTADEYNKMIQSLCLKALDWPTAEKLSEEMKANGLYLNAITRGLITAVKNLEEEALRLEEASVEA